MPTITVKGIPTEVYALLKQSAAANRRSINSQIITYIERGLRSRTVDAEELLSQARVLRRQTQAHPITDSAFRAAKQKGRP